MANSYAFKLITVYKDGQAKTQRYTLRSHAEHALTLAESFENIAYAQLNSPAGLEATHIAKNLRN